MGMGGRVGVPFGSEPQGRRQPLGCCSKLKLELQQPATSLSRRNYALERRGGKARFWYPRSGGLRSRHVAKAAWLYSLGVNSRPFTAPATIARRASAN